MENIILQSDIKNINVVEKFIDEISSRYNLHSDIYGKLSLAIVEGVNNAIVHGNKLDASLTVKVSYEINDRFIQFVIEDCGSGFDYNSIPDPTLPENIEKSHGRGIFLMNHLSDSIDFEKNGSRVILEFKL